MAQTVPERAGGMVEVCRCVLYNEASGHPIPMFELRPNLQQAYLYILSQCTLYTIYSIVSIWGRTCFPLLWPKVFRFLHSKLTGYIHIYILYYIYICICLNVEIWFPSGSLPGSRLGSAVVGLRPESHRAHCSCHEWRSTTWHMTAKCVDIYG